MYSELIIAIFSGLGGMLGWGLADLFAKKTIDEIGDITTLAWGHIFGTIVLLIVTLFNVQLTGNAVKLSLGINNWILLTIFGVIQAFVYLLVYIGFGKGKISILNPVFASFSGITALLSIIFFDEIVNNFLLSGLAILFIGILLISVDFNSLKFNKIGLSNIPGLREVGIATIFAAFWTLYWDKFIGGKDWLVYTLLMYSFMTIAIVIFAKLKKLRLFSINPSSWKYLILIGLFETIAYLAIGFGYSATTLTSVVALMSGAFSLPTIILARIFLKERITTVQTIGTVVVIIGIMVLSIV